MQEDIFSKCKIPMPSDARRNMMNASSNFEIISCVLEALRGKKREKLLIPGAFGNIGGYPVIVDGSVPSAGIDESVFSMEAMQEKNRQSLYLDGVEDVRNGCLYYTDELLAKAERAFGVCLPKEVGFDEIDKTAAFIVEKIIHPALKRKEKQA